jgi:sulfoquinovosyltransferase
MLRHVLVVCALASLAAAAVPGLGARRASVLNRSGLGARALRLVASQPAQQTNSEDEASIAPPLRSTAPLRVGLLIEPTPFTHVSGYANRFNEMLRFLRRAGDDVSIVTPDDTEQPPDEAHGYPITTVSGFRFPLYPICLSVDPDCGAQRMVETHRPALLHASSPSFLMAVALAISWLYRLPLMLSYHTHLPIYAREYLRPFNWFGWLERAAWAFIKWQHNRADLTLTTSPQLAQELRDNGVKNVEVWPKGVDTIKFDPKYKSAEMRERLGGVDPNTGEERPLLLYVGRVCESKRLQQLRHTLSAIPQATLAIVGGGPSLPRFELEFADLVEAGRVRFLGVMKGAELSEAFASADVFVMPSDSETLGFVVLESMVRRDAAHPHTRLALREERAACAAPSPGGPISGTGVTLGLVRQATLRYGTPTVAIALGRLLTARPLPPPSPFPPALAPARPRSRHHLHRPPLHATPAPARRPACPRSVCVRAACQT